MSVFRLTANFDSLNKVNFIVAWFLLSISLVEGQNYTGLERSYCHTNDDNPYLFFGTKTPYHVTRGSAGTETSCVPKQIWMLCRHGTRYASKEDLNKMKICVNLREEIIQNYESAKEPIKGALRAPDYQALKEWVWDEDVETTPEELNEQGWQDIYWLATRYRFRYPHILGGNYTPEEFYFRHTNTQRTEESCKAFIDGLFGIGSNDNIKIETPLEDDQVLMPYNTCAAWKSKVDKNVLGTIERKSFRETVEYKKLQANLSQRLGFERLLTPDIIEAMYDNCRFDKTRNLNLVSPWCSVFTKMDLFLLEYYYDLSWYYKTGHGHEYNSRLGCMPLQHMMETFENNVYNNTAQPKASILFAHDTMLDMLCSSLSFLKDQQHLSGKDFEDFLVNRKYRISLKVPFGANFIAILHECPENDTDKYAVQFLLNENPMQLKGCINGLCSWKHLEEFLAFTKSCSLEFCNLD